MSRGAILRGMDPALTTPAAACDRDTDLVARCLARPAGRAAWNELYATYAPVVRARLHFGRRAFPEHDVEDLVQVVFLKLATGALERFEGRSSLRSYLLRLADSARISENRRRLAAKRGSGRVRSYDELLEEGGGEGACLASGMPTPEDQLLHRRRTSAVRSAVDRLRDPRDREIVALYFAEDPKVDREIAEQLGMPLNTVTWRRLRALKELRRALTPFEEASP